MSKSANELEKTLDRYKEAARDSVGEITLRTTIAAIPYAGGPILELWGGVAQRRIQERLNAVFEEMKERLDAKDADEIDRAFFESEEFQTLLYLLIEKLHTTHDEEKLRSFGAALANSADLRFRSQDKEGYIRVLRDISLREIRLLRDGERVSRAQGAQGFLSVTSEKASLARLVSLGLVSETTKLKDFRPSIPVLPSSAQSAERYARGMVDMLQKYMKEAPTQTYRVTDFGSRFLTFVQGQRENPAACTQ